VGSAAARLSYVVESELSEGPLTFPVRGRGPDPRSDPAFARYLELPRLPARIAGLAREVAGDAPDAFQAAVRLSEHLSREYRYTLALERRTALDPVDEFLFVRRSGNCEYFAAALAVMLRTLGIPSRVVGGFQRGDWNPYGRYFTVRMKDAHSWVEAYVAGAGWVTLDPSPRADAEAEAAPSAAQLYLDALRMRWYRYVINWSLRDQVEAAATIRRQAGSWRVTIASLPGWRDVAAWLASGAAVVLVVGAAWLWSARRAGPRDGAVRRMPGFYARALRLLARQGFSPAAGETAREFARRVAASSPSRGEPFATLTETYERIRFGAHEVTPADLASVEANLSTLSRE
jgi:transglutaminase-like putative cysteine protease